MELNCPHCKEQIEAEAGDEFCPECGQPIKAVVAEAIAEAPSAQGAPGLAQAGSSGASATQADPGLAQAGSSGAPASQGDPSPTGAPILLIKVDGRPPLRYTGAPILIGRLDEVSGSIPDLPFNDPAISRRHLTVWQEGAKIIVQDGSTNGTFRAGLRLPQGAPVELQAGESLTLPGQMGTYTIRFDFA